MMNDEGYDECDGDGDGNGDGVYDVCRLHAVLVPVLVLVPVELLLRLLRSMLICLWRSRGAEETVALQFDGPPCGGSRCRDVEIGNKLCSKRIPECHTGKHSSCEDFHESESLPDYACALVTYAPCCT